MNYALMEQIIRHIMANLSIISTPYINNVGKNLRSKEFLSDKKIKFEINDAIIEHNVYSCETMADAKRLKILLADCSAIKTNVLEFALMVCVEDMPTYGLYLVFNDLEKTIHPEPMIAVSLNSKDFMICNTYLQNTFCAGMEELRELGFNWAPHIITEEDFSILSNFIDYHDDYYLENE